MSGKFYGEGGQYRQDVEGSEDWSKYTDTLTTDSVTISPEKPLKITGEIYIDVDSVNSSRNKFTYSDVSPEELAKEEEGGRCTVGQYIQSGRMFQQSCGASL